MLYESQAAQGFRRNRKFLTRWQLLRTHIPFAMYQAIAYIDQSMGEDLVQPGEFLAVIQPLH